MQYDRTGYPRDAAVTDPGAHPHQHDETGPEAREPEPDPDATYDLVSRLVREYGERYHHLVAADGGGHAAVQARRQAAEAKLSEVLQVVRELAAPAQVLHQVERDDEPPPRGRVRRCEADARRGTGTGACGRPLDARGLCDRAGEHLDRWSPC